MNIKSLRAFRATLSEGSLAAAGHVLHLSQPAVSRLISGLEGELRLDLFDRSGRNLTPTPEGLAFYREAGRILDNLDEIPNIAAEIRAGRTESLRIVAMPRVARAL
ncbi:MAG: LysR family transcriptional regulator, partial [Paracoccaceae bacterium]